jgi:hypothetical protein
MKLKLPLLGAFTLFSLFLHSCSNTASVNPETSTRKNLLSEETFDSFWFSQDKYFSRQVNWAREIATSYGVTFVKMDDASGNFAARFELQKADPLVAGGKRAELVAKPETNPNRWYGMSIYLPADYEDDAYPEVLAQWHGMPDIDLGEDWTKAPLTLQTQNGQYTMAIQWAANPVNDYKSIDGSKQIDLGPVAKNEWTHFVFHINYSYQSDGVLEIWRNGVKIATYNGPNSYNDKSYPYFKFGIYKPVWEDKSITTGLIKRVVYIDNVRIGNESATYDDVAPQFN